eukprot:3021895-Amphidinium_carterae.1
MWISIAGHAGLCKCSGVCVSQAVIMKTSESESSKFTVNDIIKINGATIAEANHVRHRQNKVQASTIVVKSLMKLFQTRADGNRTHKAGQQQCDLTV